MPDSGSGSVSRVSRPSRVWSSETPVDSLFLLRGRRYGGRSSRHVKVTINMGAFLHYLLSSISYREGEFVLEFDDETREIMRRNFNYYDLVDTYCKLGLNSGLFGDYIVRKSHEYVIKKTISKSIKNYYYERCKKNASKGPSFSQGGSGSDRDVHD